MKFLYCASIILSVMILSGCAQKASVEYTESDTETREGFILKDLQEFPQYSQAYADNILARSSLLSAQKEYDKKYFLPWTYADVPFSLNEILWPFSSYTYEKSYGENLLPLTKEWFENMRQKGNFGAYGTLNKKAISLCYLNLRNFPTHKPVFKDPEQAGEGFPFDYLQNSGIHANEPLFVSHLSADGQWAYIFTSYATGWVALRDIAYVNNEIAEKYMNARQINLIDEFYPIKDLAGNVVFESRVGMRLPLVSIEDNHYITLAITQGRDHTATYTKVAIPFHVGREDNMKFNVENLIHISDLMLQSNYGWGGLYKERDCSSTLRDLYAPFGLWLPRNSSQQSRIGKVISLEDLTLEQKREVIIKNGIPFETLLYKQGHILLYLGVHKGKITVLHNAWGVKTIKDGVEGRTIIGKTVISSLDIGDELEDYNEAKGIPLNLTSMNIVTQKEE